MQEAVSIEAHFQIKENNIQLFFLHSIIYPMHKL